MAVTPADGMGAEKRGHYAGRDTLADAPDYAEHLELVGRIEPVAALYLQAAGALLHDLAHAAHGLGVQFVLSERVQQVGRVEYAAAPAGYLGIAQAANLVDKLALTAACIHHVGMWVAPRRQHHASAGVDHNVGPQTLRRHVVHAAEGCKASVVSKQPGIVERVQPGHLASAKPQLAAYACTDKRGYVLNEQAHCS